MGRDDIKITISGVTASGKSTLAYIIQEHLLNTGFTNVGVQANVDYIDGSELRQQMIPSINARKEIMRKKHILIDEVQLNAKLNDIS